MTAPEPQEHCEKEPMYLVTKKELDMIKNDCAYPTRQFCDGCEYADGEDPERASGLGCNFIGANALMDIVLTRQQQPRDVVGVEIKQCPHHEIRNGNSYCHCEYDKEHDAAIKAEAQREEREKLKEAIGVISSNASLVEKIACAKIMQKFESLRRSE